MQILKGHRTGTQVIALDFSPDGTRLVSYGIDGKTILWDPAGGGHRVIGKEKATAVAFSPDGKAVARSSYHTVTFWDIDAAQSRVVAWDGFACDPAIRFGADGGTIIGAGLTVGIWHIASGRRVPASDSEGAETQDATRCLAVTPDRKTTTTGHGRRDPRCVRVWDVEALALRDEITGPTAFVSALALSPDGKHLAAACGTTLWVWEVASKRVAVKHSIGRLYFKDVAFTPDGRFLVFARNDATVSLWDTASWAEAARYDFGVGPMVSVACAPDGMRAAAGSAKGKIVVFDIDV